jgi:hypothetical protein
LSIQGSVSTLTPDENVDLGDCYVGQPDELESPETIVDDSDTIEVNDVTDAGPRHSSRARRPNTQYVVYRATEGISIPKSYKAAITNQYHSADWDRAIKEELCKL